MWGKRAYVSVQRLGSEDCASEQRGRVSQQMDHAKQVTAHLPGRYSNSQPHCHLAVLMCGATGFSCSGMYTRDRQILFLMKNMLF